MNSIVIDHGSIALLATYVIFALAFSFLCSIAEAVLLSINPAFIESQRKVSQKYADLLERLKGEHVDRSLAAILTLNTIAHTVGAIASGAEASKVFGSTWFGLFSAVMTLAILFLSEIIPKTIGAVYWRHLSKPVAYFVKFLIISLAPLVLISELLTKLLSRGNNQNFSRDELIAMARIGEKSGSIETQEAHIIENLFVFSSLRAKDIMTPRTVIGALPDNTSVSDAVDYVIEHPFSRIPLFKENLDHIDGFVLRFDILLAHKQGKGNHLVSSLKRELPIVAATQPLFSVTKHLIQSKSHITAVVNEYGGINGIITLEDLIETLVGFEIVDEVDKNKNMKLLARELWRQRAKSMGINPENTENI